MIQNLNPVKRRIRKAKKEKGSIHHLMRVKILKKREKNAKKRRKKLLKRTNQTKKLRKKKTRVKKMRVKKKLRVRKMRVKKKNNYIPFIF